MCCNRTLGEVGAGMIPHGVVSSTGWGDGAYVINVARRNGYVYFIEVLFIDDEEDSALSTEDSLGW